MALASAVGAPLMAVTLVMSLTLISGGAASSTGAAAGATVASGDSEACVTNISTADVESMDNNEDATMLVNALLGDGSVDLRGLEFSTIEIAGILGNFQKESSVTFAKIQGGSTEKKSNSSMRSYLASNGGGIGLAQWTGTRATSLIDYAEDNDLNWYDGEAQIGMLVKELAGSYSSVKSNMEDADSVKDAADIFHNQYEVSADTDLSARENYAEEWYDRLEGYSSSSTTSGSCTTGSDADVGSVGGAPEVYQSDFSWMCDAMKVCEAGDYGTFAAGDYGYQCVWYAWTRLKMIHPDDDWSIVLGNGGDIWSNAQSTDGWIVDTTPHPGDGLSGHGQPFAASTHVAVVEEVVQDGDSWKIRISEGNVHQGSGAAPCYYGSKGCWVSYRGDRWLSEEEALAGDNHFFRYSTW